MTTWREAAQQALEALETPIHEQSFMQKQNAITNLRAALAEPVQEPLTDEEIVDAVRQADLDWQAGWTLDEDAPNRFTTLTRVIEQAHGIGGEK